MGKYEPLGLFLKKQNADRIPITFKEIERILNAKLPESKRNRAWWSNNPENNVMTREWLEAGYETEAVDTKAEKLVLRRTLNNSKHNSGVHPMFGCMKGMVTLPEDFDPERPFHDLFDWEAWEKEKYGPLKESN